MYCATRLVITCHAEITTITVMKAVSGTNHSDRPSMPSEYMMWKRCTHGDSSTNCMPWAALSKCVISGMVAARLIERTDQRADARGAGIAVAAQGQHQHPEQDRKPDRQAQVGRKSRN